MPTILKTKNSVTTTVVPTTLQQGELAVNITDKKLWVGNAATTPVQLLGAGVTGDVVGPASATDNAISRFDATTGKLIQNSLVTVSDTGAISAPVDASISGLTVGKGAGASSTNTTVGASTLSANTSGTNLSALGFGVLFTNTSGIHNSGLGWAALNQNTTGGYNTAVGSGSLQANTTASFNTALGYESLNDNTTGANNTALGFQTLPLNSTGASNTAVGYQSLQANTTASENTAIGFQAGFSNTTGTALVALGYRAAYNNTTGSASTAVGYLSGFANTTGEITAIGYSALTANTTGTFNTALGRNSLVSNTTGGNNTAVGRQALNGNTTANNNTAVGYQAGFSNTTGIENTFIGNYAGRSTTTANRSAYVGHYAGYNTTGANNNFFGEQAGYLVTSGAKNTILGRYDGNLGGLDIRTADNYIVLSDGDGNPRAYCDNAGGWTVANSLKATTYLWAAGTGTAGGLYLGVGGSTGLISQGSSGSGTVTTYIGNAAIATVSDVRLKENIVDTQRNALNLINQLRVVDHTWNDPSDQCENNRNSRGTWMGLIAQEAQPIIPWLVNKPLTEKDEQGVTQYWHMDYGYSVPLLIKAIQELNAKVEAQALEIATLKGN